ncbi:MAG TPA: hypothetical protein VH142_03050 [Polyangiaceae bacterium]|jgi:hypothetical protein|nr:hypothetical protein [Polyangiaceae bacterium]
MPLLNNGVIKVAFDRYINPLTMNRQGILLRDLFDNAPDSPIIQYDPVTRTASISNPGPDPNWLVEGTTYELSFPVATTEAGSFGLLAIDGATMDPATQKIAFTVIPRGDAGAAPTLPTIDFCSDILPLFYTPRSDFPFVQGLCSNVSCHGASSTNDYAATGLVLNSPTSVKQTAIGVEATEATTGALSVPITAQNSFPVGMPIIDPGDPAHSYLIYKLLLPDVNGAPDGTGAGFSYTTSSGCNPRTAPFDYGPNPHLASADEAGRLAQFIHGRRMPWGDPIAPNTFTTNGGTPLTLDELERISVWIQEGAQVPDQCSPTCSATH